MARIYEVEMWFEGDDFTKKGKYDQFSYDALLQLAGGKKGWGFMKVNAFLKSDEGLKWINDQLTNRNINHKPKPTQ